MNMLTLLKEFEGYLTEVLYVSLFSGLLLFLAWIGASLWS